MEAGLYVKVIEYFIDFTWMSDRRRRVREQGGDPRGEIVNSVKY